MSENVKLTISLNISDIKKKRFAWKLQYSRNYMVLNL